MDPELNCSHCTNEYSEDNPPRLLTHCGHTFCERCLFSLSSTEGNYLRIICPQDSKILELNASVKSLPKNLALMKYLEGKQKQGMIEFKDDSSFEVSKITKNQQSQEDEDAKELITVMHGHGDNETKPTLSKFNSSKQQGRTQSESECLLPDEPEIELCLLHQKPIEVICLNDMQRLCSKCAIFGQHKGHDFRGLEQIEAQNKKYYNQIISIFEQKEGYNDRNSTTITEQQLVSILATKANKMKKEISQKYKKIADQLSKAEKMAVRRLEEAVRGVEKKMKRLLVMDDSLLNNFDAWEATSLAKIKQNESHSQDHSIAFYLDAKDIILQGNNILIQLRRQEQKALASAEQFINHLGIQYYDTQCITALNSVVQIYEQEELQRKSNLLPITSQSKQNDRFLANREPFDELKALKNIQIKHESDESLLDLDDFESQKSPVIALTHYFDDSFEKVDLPKQQTMSKSMSLINQLPTPKRFTQKKPTNPILFCKQAEKNRQGPSNQPPSVRDTIKKKIKNIKVPQKYQKILEGIIVDSLETVDLTNAELGDNVILQICQLMKNNTKPRTLKLIRNKLTDEGFAKIIPLLTGISTLNLSQNVLTEQSLICLSNLRSSLPQLRAVILSQNKIVERKSRPMIDKLRKMELTISI